MWRHPPVAMLTMEMFVEQAFREDSRVSLIWKLNHKISFAIMPGDSEIYGHSKEGI
jgi:hypothetical protein